MFHTLLIWTRHQQQVQQQLEVDDDDNNDDYDVLLCVMVFLSVMMISNSLMGLII